MARVLHLALTGFLSLVLLSAPVLANSGSSSAAPKDQNFAEGERLVEAEEFAAAIPFLESSLASNAKNADAENYLGYSHRRLGDSEAALQHYQRALDLDPKHRGANEYLGELYLEMGELPKAEERLDVLDGACFWGCDEYRDLEAEIAEYKAKNGG